MPLQLPTEMLNDSLKEVVFLRKNQPRFKKLSKKSHFDQREVEALALIHRKIQSQTGPVTKTTFRDVLHSGLDYTENVRHLLVDRLFSAFVKKNALQVNSKDSLPKSQTSNRQKLNLKKKINTKFLSQNLFSTN